MELDFRNTVTLVTGAGSGIGKAISIELAHKKGTVILCGRTLDKLMHVQTELKHQGIVVQIHQCDVSSQIEVKQMVSHIGAQFGRIDNVVHSAGGINTFADFEQLSPRDWVDSYENNFLGVVFVIQEALSLLRKSAYPSIVIIGSTSASEPGSYNPHYTTAKAAVLNLAKYLANRYAKEHIRVNSICAGPVHSNLWDNNVQFVATKFNVSLDETRSNFEHQETVKVPLGRIGEPADISGIVLFLLSKQASWISGTTIKVDGNKHRSMD